jgi:cytoskeletal protein CcmA (bactofilin family)
MGLKPLATRIQRLPLRMGAADAARSFYLKITSSVDLTTTRIVTLAPNTVSKVWMIENATTGSQVITIKQGSGATINVPNGQVKMISTDGAGSGGAVLDLLVDVDLTGTTTLVNLDVSGTLGVTGVLTATSLDISGDIDVDGTTNLDVVDIDGAVDMASTLLVTGVLTTTAATVSNGGGQFNGTVTVGVDDTGYDVKFFGATTGKSLLWDESADSLIVTGTTTLVGTTNLDAVDIDGATQIDATVTVGVDDTGYDVKFFGATAGAYMLWDESADDLILGGAAGLSVNSTALVTGVLTTTAATVHTGGITMPDNAKAIFGTGSDLEIYFNGSDGIINESVAGNLLIQGDNIYLQNSAATASYLRGVDGGAIDLRYAGNEKLATTATGIDVTGTVVADGLRLDGTACIGLNVAPSEFGGGVATITLKGTTSAKSGAIKFIDDNDTSVASIFAQNDINYGLSIGTLGGYW